MRMDARRGLSFPRLYRVIFIFIFCIRAYCLHLSQVSVCCPCKIVCKLSFVLSVYSFVRVPVCVCMRVRVCTWNSLYCKDFALDKFFTSYYYYYFAIIKNIIKITVLGE